MLISGNRNPNELKPKREKITVFANVTYGKWNWIIGKTKSTVSQ
jgi:hypothetical protein